MTSTVTPIDVPACSAASLTWHDADFHDCYRVDVDAAGHSAMSLYLRVMGRTPGWIGALMTLRNKVGRLVGLKDLGAFTTFDATRPTESYRPGERIGIFTLVSVSDHEVVVEDNDKHLRVVVSVCKMPWNGGEAVAVSTVVHEHYWLGRLYMLFVRPMHRIIAPRMLAQA